MSSPGRYGVSEQLQSAGEAAPHVERIRLTGFSVVRRTADDAALRDLSNRVDALLTRQAAEAGGPQRLAEIGEHETARCCLAYDEAFLALATDPLALQVVGQLLGDYFVLMQQNAIVNHPSHEHTQRAYHRDLPYQHFVSSRPLAISALYCVDPFTTANGATVVVPASHKLEAFPSDGVAASLETAVEAPAGSFIVFDSMLFHRAGVNRSSSPRRGVNHVYSLPFIAQQISIPAMLNGRYADDPALARLLGYDSGTVTSPAAWWERRRARVRR